jgi:hypothetical protein
VSISAAARAGSNPSLNTDVTELPPAGARCYGRRRLRWRVQVPASIHTELSEASTAIVTSTAGTPTDLVTLHDAGTGRQHQPAETPACLCLP